MQSVQPPDLSIVTTPDGQTVNAGDALSFDIVVSNSSAAGTGTATASATSQATSPPRDITCKSPDLSIVKTADTASVDAGHQNGNSGIPDRQPGVHGVAVTIYRSWRGRACECTGARHRLEHTRVHRGGRVDPCR